MARFFSYDEITAYNLTPVDDIRWIAGQIAGLPPFVEMTAVLCGSVSWGKFSWRSDIDIAHFSTLEHPHLERSIGEVLDDYRKRTDSRFIAPRIDVITVGAQSTAGVSNGTSLSAESVSVELPDAEHSGVDMFADSAVRFADHIGSIAKLKGDPWKTFLERYLAQANLSKAARHDSIKHYVERISKEWENQPLHQFNLGPDGQFSAKQLNLISKSENYPINLMRRLLADLDAYPCPDRSNDVLENFSALNTTWSEELLTHFKPFFSLDERYQKLVAACARPEKPLSAADYYEELRSMFVNLSFPEIQDCIWRFLRG